MTKADFIALADTTRATRPEPSKTVNGTQIFAGAQAAKLEQWNATRDALADMCAKSNPAFKRGRWLDYIAGKVGPNGGKV